MSGYTLKTIKFTNCWKSVAYIMAAIGNKLAECDNITISTPGPSLNGVKFNNDTLKLNYYSASSGYVGFGQVTGTGYVQLFDVPSSNSNGRTPFITVKIIIDSTNNLVAVLNDNKRLQNVSGVLFTNGGIKNLNDTNIYPIGSSTYSKRYAYSGVDAGNNSNGVVCKNDFDIYVSDCFVESGGVVELCDHLRYVHSNVKNIATTSVAANAFERINIDGQTYMRMEGNLWIPIGSEVSETVEVTYS